MSHKRFIFYMLITFLFGMSVAASEYQWSVKLKGFVSPETNDNPEAFLWISSNCSQVKAVVVGQHNMCEETIFEHPEFRKTMAELGFAIIWITPGIDQQWDVKNGCQKVFDEMMKELAEKSGYTELQFAPVVPLGHSAMATFPWNFAAWNPGRTLAIISYHGDAPRTNLTGYGGENLEWGRNRNIDGIPGLMIEGEYEWWEARVNPALAFRMMYPESCISFLCDAGHGHFDVSEDVVDYMCLFLKKAATYRLPKQQSLDQATVLTKVDVMKGWLAERWHPVQPKRSKAAPFMQYKGDAHDAFWYFDQEIAVATEQYYAKNRNKKHQFIGLTHNGSLIPYRPNRHVKYDLSNLKPGADGITYHFHAVFTDSLHQQFTNAHSKTPIQVSRIDGPIEKVNDTTFRVKFNRMGFNNAKRTNNFTLCAYNDGDANFKSTVQEFSMKIDYPLIEGKRQAIFFPALQNVSQTEKEVVLLATTDSGLPVSYYVKEGPVEEKDGRLTFTKIPPRAKFPITVTVVAWQLGLERTVQSAEPVERSFLIVK